MIVYLALLVLGAVALAILRGLALGWPEAIAPAVLAGAVAIGMFGYLRWTGRAGGPHAPERAGPSRSPEPFDP